MDDMTLDYLHGSDVFVYQRKDMFRINTDTALLAAFMNVKKGEHVLDVGTNNGALLLAAYRMNPGHLYGVDIQANAIEVARKNMEAQHIQNVSLLCGDICNIDLPKVHVVVCNPPYFQVHEHSNLNQSQMIQMARHETYLHFDDLCKKVSSLLDEKGRFYLVHRANRIRELMSVLHDYRLETKTLQFIYDEHKKEAIGVLIEAIKDGKVNAHVREGIYIKR